MDLNSLIGSFATAASYTVTRRTRATPIRGKAQSPTTATFTIVASVQPATGRDLMRLPELRRSMETRVLFTTTQLLVGDSTRDADLVTIGGVNWECQQVQRWEQAASQGIGYRCIVQAPV